MSRPIGTLICFFVITSQTNQMDLSSHPLNHLEEEEAIRSDMEA